MNELPIALLHELFVVADDGILIRKRVTGKSTHIGQVVGSITHDGYLSVRINRHLFAVHRIVFAMTNGYWPSVGIDHINMNKLDNRPCNLREATESENGMNRGKQANNSTGEKGVIFDKSRGLYRAQIQVRGKAKHLGRYAAKEDASRAYKSAAIFYHGEFAMKVDSLSP